MSACDFEGRLTADIEVVMRGDKRVTNFTLAVPREYAKDTTDFLHFEAWEKNAEYMSKHGRKGAMYTVLCYVKTTPREKNGVKWYDTTFVVERARLLSFAKKDEGKGNNTPPNESFNTEQNRGVVGDSNFEELSSTDSLPF